MKKTRFKEQIDITQGLSDAEVLARRKQFGWHNLKPIAESSLTLLFRQINSPFMYLLIGAGIFSFILKDITNGLIIFLIIAINTALSFYQEYRASQAARLLASYIIPTARVRRNGAELIIQTKELVPGDVVIINSGDAVPADLNLVQSDSLTVDESALTGESTPIEKNISDKEHASLFMGTSIITGSGLAMVTATGADTRFGQISTLTLLAPHESSFQEQLAVLSKFLIKLTLILLVCVLIINIILKGAHTDIMQLLLFCVALAVTVTPEALPVVTTFALSEGAFQLAKQKVIVKRLAAIEDLGSITMLCTDKTGTLTENKLSVSDVLKYQDKDPLFLASIAQKKMLSVFETATVVMLSPEQKNKLEEYRVVNETAFNPVHRRTSKVIVGPDKKNILVVKGAFEEVISRCINVDSNALITLTQWTNEHEVKGERVIAIAAKPKPKAMLLFQSRKKSLPYMASSRLRIHKKNCSGCTPQGRITGYKNQNINRR